MTHAWECDFMSPESLKIVLYDTGAERDKNPNDLKLFYQNRIYHVVDT
jgi:hypothetical protein